MEFMPKKTVETPKPETRKPPTQSPLPEPVERVKCYIYREVRKAAVKELPFPWRLLSDTSDNIILEMKPRKQRVTCRCKNLKRTQKKASCNNENGDFASETKKKQKTEKPIDGIDVFAAMFGHKTERTTVTFWEGCVTNVCERV
ncbi:uncharacterized protein LOC112564716 [Pomacea canaliculata]|uniref:uncharacterized protein LOC112564716 n=1 Tax=Pomacea canaliculata TaxID=400727 RepID=UPI000D72A436|nr:uncharacterized protein LOC112564716 [Pomacea canaliculata]XP_025095524.1 uncharacterized protein LOC112564716 [Pomacea canaliculata]XP_025095534.1 uncharacterized protein LOC112564716 [Pomacea canaliculata]XP_025095542.1 uncharacterized protein LOC112564716 [Pomacea canaliculata]